RYAFLTLAAAFILSKGGHMADNFLDELRALIQSRARHFSEVVETNLRIGERLHQRYNSSGGEKLLHLAFALNKKGVRVSSSLLHEAYSVWEAIGGEKGYCQIKEQRGNVSWTSLVREYGMLRNNEASKALWEGFMSDTEFTHEDRASFLMDHYHDLSEEIKNQATGYLAAMVYAVPDQKKVAKILHTGDIHFDNFDRLSDIVESGRN